MSEEREEFLKECQGTKPSTTEEIIERNNLKWFIGKAAKGEEGFAGLSLSSATMLTVREEHIAAVEKTDLESIFRIGIKPDAEIVLTQTKVVKLDECECAGGAGGIVFTPTRFDLNKVAGFEVEVDDSVYSPGIPGYRDPCLEARDKAFDNCMRWPGSYTTMCGAISAAAETGCRNIRLGP